MKVVNAVQKLLDNTDSAQQGLNEIKVGIANQSDLLNRKLDQLIAGMDNQSDLLNRQLNRVVTAVSGVTSAAARSGPESVPSNSERGETSYMANGASGSGPVLSTKVAPRTQRNHLEDYSAVFEGVVPWRGNVPKGYLVDFSGAKTDGSFRTMFGVDPSTVGGNYQETRLPVIGDGEGWFEAANWVLAAREARESYVMITLGACYGAQAVGAYRILQQINPVPCTLVAVEPVPENYEWIVQHFCDNGIDPDQHWVVPHAISDSNQPVLFPIGAPGTGAQNCISTNEDAIRQQYADEFITSGHAEDALRNILQRNTTGIVKDLVPGSEFMAEIKLISAITLKDLLGPFAVVDYLEADIQQSEIVVFPPFIDLLRKKVRRIHIGTHGVEVHRRLHDLFEANGWEIVFSFEPNAKHETALGTFETNDGVLTVRNPDL